MYFTCNRCRTIFLPQPLPPVGKSASQRVFARWPRHCPRCASALIRVSSPGEVRRALEAGR